MERDLYRGERKAEERLPLISLKLDLVDLLEDNALPVSLAYMYEERLEDIVVLPEDQQRAELLKIVQDAKPRLERLIESFMEQTAREIEGGRL